MWFFKVQILHFEIFEVQKKTSYDVLFLWLDLFFWIQIIWSFRFNKYKCFFIGMLFLFVTVTNLLQDVKDWYVRCWYYYKILWLICKSVKIGIFLYFYVLIIGRNSVFGDDFLMFVVANVLILVGLSDIWCDIWFLDDKLGKCGFFRGFWSALKLSWCVDELAYGLHGKQNKCSSFWYAPL